MYSNKLQLISDESSQESKSEPSKIESESESSNLKSAKKYKYKEMIAGKQASDIRIIDTVKLRFNLFE